MRSPPGCGWGFPSLAPRQGPARNSLRSLCSLRSDSLAELEGWRACGARPCLGARAGGAKGADPEQPNPTAGPRAAVCRQRADSWVWLLAVRYSPLCAAGFAAKAGVGQKLPALTSFASVKQSARVSSRGALRAHPSLCRKPGGAEGQPPTAKPSYRLAACSQPLEVRLLGLAGGVPPLLRRRLWRQGKGARLRRATHRARADCLTGANRR